MDVSTWTPIWTNPNLALEPVVGAANGGVAMQDLNTGLLHEVAADGSTVSVGAFGGRWAYQTRFGMWTSEWRVALDGHALYGQRHSSGAQQSYRDCRAQSASVWAFWVHLMKAAPGMPS